MYRTVTNETIYKSDLQKELKMELWSALEVNKGLGGSEVKENDVARWWIHAISGFFFVFIHFKTTGSTKIQFPCKVIVSDMDGEGDDYLDVQGHKNGNKCYIARAV